MGVVALDEVRLAQLGRFVLQLELEGARDGALATRLVELWLASLTEQEQQELTGT